MLTRFKRCCCWLPGITNRSRNQLHIRTDFFFFALPLLFSPRPPSTLMRALDTWIGPEKRSSVCHARCHEGRPNFRRSSHGRHGGFRPVHRPAGRPPPPPSRLMGTRPERAVETVGDLGLGSRDRGVSKSNTHARFRSGFQRQAARGHGRGGQRWKVKAVEFTGSRRPGARPG